MSGTRRPRPSGLMAFWSLLGEIERLTQLEFEAVRSRDFQSMDTLFEQKRSEFKKLQMLGRRLGMTRQNPELGRRLFALERAQARVVEAAGDEIAALRAESEGADLESHRLRSLKRAYVSDTQAPDFDAEG